MKKKGILRFFNLFDIVVLLVAAALAAMLILSNFLGQKRNEVQVRYVIEAPRMESGVAENIHAGDQLVDRIKKYGVGTVEKVETFPARILVNDLINGGAVYAEVPGEETVRVTVVANAVVTAAHITVDNGYYVRVGGQAAVKGPGYQLAGTIVILDRDAVDQALNGEEAAR